MICVGVSAELAAEEDYMCVTCSTTNAGRRKWDGWGRQPVYHPILLHPFCWMCNWPCPFPKLWPLTFVTTVLFYSLLESIVLNDTIWSLFCIFTAFFLLSNCLWLSKSMVNMLNEYSGAWVCVCVALWCGGGTLSWIAARVVSSACTARNATTQDKRTVFTKYNK